MPGTTAPPASVDVLVRNDTNGRLPLELMALFSYSISRALDSLEEAAAAEIRLALTHQVIDPLERARAVLLRALRRRGSRERFVLPHSVVMLCDMQFRALCAASREPGFPWDELPGPLRNTAAAHRRFCECAGLTASGRAPRAEKPPNDRHGT